jgi:hypothetical protein
VRVKLAHPTQQGDLHVDESAERETGARHADGLGGDHAAGVFEQAACGDLKLGVIGGGEKRFSVLSVHSEAHGQDGCVVAESWRR